MSVKPSAVMASAVFLSMFSRHRLASCGSSNSRAYEGQHINISPNTGSKTDFRVRKLVTNFKSYLRAWVPAQCQPQRPGGSFQVYRLM